MTDDKTKHNFKAERAAEAAYFKSCTDRNIPIQVELLALSDACQAYREVAPIDMPPLTHELDHILGQPNFTLGGAADVYRATGEKIARKSEREQAFVLHQQLTLYLLHGETEWRKHWVDDMQRRVDELKDADEARP